MIEPTAADVGRRVVYSVKRNDLPFADVGVVSSFNDLFVFVLYDGELYAKATRRCDLIWEPESNE